jgi:hypothetical protein
VSNSTNNRNPAPSSQLSPGPATTLTGNRNNPPCGGASCPGMSHPGILLAPGVASRAEDASQERSASAVLGPGVPSRTYEGATTTPTPASSPRLNASATPNDTVAEAVAHLRRRLAVPRTHRVNPCFSDGEWAEISAAALACQLTPGGFTAAAAVAYSRVDRRISIDDERHLLEDQMNTNRALGATGGHLNRLAHHLNSGGTPSTHSAGFLLQRVSLAVTQVDAAVMANSASEPRRPNRSPSSVPPSAADITRLHRERMSTPRRNRTHPCFSDSEWADLTTAASACHLQPGGYAAATTLLAARTSDPRAAIADTRRRLEELMESNRQLAAIGNNLNQVLLHLRPGDALHAMTAHTLHLTRAALDDVDSAAAEIAWK